MKSTHQVTHQKLFHLIASSRSSHAVFNVVFVLCGEFARDQPAPNTSRGGRSRPPPPPRAWLLTNTNPWLCCPPRGASPPSSGALLPDLLRDVHPPRVPFAPVPNLRRIERVLQRARHLVGASSGFSPRSSNRRCRGGWAPPPRRPARRSCDVRGGYPVSSSRAATGFRPASPPPCVSSRAPTTMDSFTTRLSADRSTRDADGTRLEDFAQVANGPHLAHRAPGKVHLRP